MFTTLLLAAAVGQCPGGACYRPAPAVTYSAPAPAVVYRPAYAAPVYTYAAPLVSGCPGGVCPAPIRRRGWFRR